MIDSAIDLSSIRQQINELEFNLQYRQLDLEQSKFESPAYQRKMQTAYNQTVRQIDRRKRDYELRKMHLENRTKRNENRYNYHKEIQKNWSRRWKPPISQLLNRGCSSMLGSVESGRSEWGMK